MIVSPRVLHPAETHSKPARSSERYCVVAVGVVEAEARAELRAVELTVDIAEGLSRATEGEKGGKAKESPEGHPSMKPPPPAVGLQTALPCRGLSVHRAKP